MRSVILITAMAAVAATTAFAQEVSALGGGILEQSRLAQQAVTNHDKTTALDHVGQALTMANQIKTQTPPGQPLVVPVTRETDVTSTYGPVKRRNSGELTAERLKKHTSVREVEGEVTVTKLDVASAATHLEAAQTALEANDFTAANAALDAVLKSVVQQHVTGDMPRLKARENLVLARSRITEGKPKAAVAPLEAAAQALTMTTGAHAQDAQAMGQQIEAFASGIQNGQEVSTATIDAWVNTIDRWQ